ISHPRCTRKPRSKRLLHTEATTIGKDWQRRFGGFEPTSALELTALSTGFSFPQVFLPLTCPAPRVERYGAPCHTPRVSCGDHPYLGGQRCGRSRGCRAGAWIAGRQQPVVRRDSY